MNQIPEVSVVIPAYNAASTISDQLIALTVQVDAPPFEVIVANNRSTDDTAAIAESFSDQLELRIVPAFSEQGVNYARNTGIASARGLYIALLDADDRAQEHTIRSLWSTLHKNPELGIVGGILSTRDPQSYKLETPQRYLPYAPGCIMAFRREVYEAIGGFDESFIGGHDEVDFCWRAQHAGFGIGLAREAILDRTDRSTAHGTFRQFHRYGYTYIQLWVKHRARGIPGSSARSELRGFRNAVTSLRKLRSKQPDVRLSAYRELGWTLGRWRGNLKYRAWGPR